MNFSLASSDQITKEINGKQICVRGWVASRRDHGGVIFIDLRDYAGIAQVVIDPTCDFFDIADQCRNEFVIEAKGTVRFRPEGMRNERLVSGEMEVEVSQLTLINRATTPAMDIGEEFAQQTSEEVRLKHRYLDLRRASMQKNLKQRSAAARSFRNALDAEGFDELETPILTVSSPEGAREFLVPSRLNHGSFYALAQSPQVYKQLYMASGFPKYYQICRCFRDEDLRHDRQPEFTQVDIEMAWPQSQETVLGLAEDVTRKVFSEVGNIDLGPLTRLSYDQAMRDYGSDKPDLRFDQKLIEVSDVFKDESFKVFQAPATNPNQRVAVLRFAKADDITRAKIDDYTKEAQKRGAGGLAWIRIKDSLNREDLSSPIIKFLSDEALAKLFETAQAQPGDILFFGAGDTGVVNEVLGYLRLRICTERETPVRQWAMCVVDQFPLLTRQADGRLAGTHNPFTRPASDDWREDPTKAVSLAYDLVINGYEVAGGSIRNHNAELQREIFKKVGLSDADIETRFGYLLKALASGCPPHGGIAFGLDRILMLLCGGSIREVVAFPKTQTASDVMTGAPNEVGAEHLVPLAIRSTAQTVDQNSAQAGEKPQDS